MSLRAGLLFAFLLLVSTTAMGQSGMINLGNPKSPLPFSLRISDPYPPQHEDSLTQPVPGHFVIHVLPRHVDVRSPEAEKYRAKGLFVKRIGKSIRIHVRSPPTQEKDDYYDINVQYRIPGRDVRDARLKHMVRYHSANTDVLLLLDHSLSMKDNDRNDLRFDSAINFISQAEYSDKITGIAVSLFSESAIPVQDWEKPGNIRGLREKLSRISKRRLTDFDDALLHAIEMFEGRPSREKIVILLSDGRNTAGRYGDTHMRLIEKGIHVITVGLSREADVNLLQNISRETKGLFFMAEDDSGLHKIYDRLASEVTSLHDIANGEAVDFVSFQATEADSMILMNLYGFPAGTVFALESPEGNRQTLPPSVGSLLHRVAKPSSGKWTLTAHYPEDSGRFTYNIRAETSLFMKLFHIRDKYFKAESFHLAVSLAKAETPLTGIDVKGGLIGPDGRMASGNLILFDDGLHGDNRPNDGVYCSVFDLDYDGGSYTAFVTAEGNVNGQVFSRKAQKTFVIDDSVANTEGRTLRLTLDPPDIVFEDVETGVTVVKALYLKLKGDEDEEPQDVFFSPGAILTLQPDVTDNSVTLDWSQFTFPRPVKLRQDSGNTFRVEIAIPEDQPTGKYKGSIVVRAGQLRQTVPVMLTLVEPKELARVQTDNIETAVTSTDRITSDVPSALKTPRHLPRMAMSGPSIESLGGPLPVRPSDLGSPEVIPVQIAEMEEVQIPTPSPSQPFAFEVLPSTEISFHLEAGEEYTTRFIARNISSASGEIQVELTAVFGQGELSRRSILLKPGEEREVRLDWIAPADLRAGDQGILEVAFESRETDRTKVVKRLQYEIRYPALLRAFWTALAITLALCLYHLLRWLLSSKRGKTSIVDLVYYQRLHHPVLSAGYALCALFLFVALHWLLSEKSPREVPAPVEIVFVSPETPQLSEGVDSPPNQSDPSRAATELPELPRRLEAALKKIRIREVEARKVELNRPDQPSTLAMPEAPLQPPTLTTSASPAPVEVEAPEQIYVRQVQESLQTAPSPTELAPSEIESPERMTETPRTRESLPDSASLVQSPSYRATPLEPSRRDESRPVVSENTPVSMPSLEVSVETEITLRQINTGEAPAEIPLEATAEVEARRETQAPAIARPVLESESAPARIARPEYTPSPAATSYQPERNAVMAEPSPATAQFQSLQPEAPQSIEVQQERPQEVAPAKMEAAPAESIVERSDAKVDSSRFRKDIETPGDIDIQRGPGVDFQGNAPVRRDIRRLPTLRRELRAPSSLPSED